MKPQDKWKKSFSNTPRSHHDKFWEKVNKSNDCWIWLGHIDKDGYGKFWNYLAHRFAWIDSFGEIPKGKYVCHKCDNPSCVNPSHLFLGTQFDNMKDMITKGRINSRVGELNPKSKLTEKDVRFIHEAYKFNGYNRTDLAKRFGVTKTCISYALAGKSWHNIWLEYNG